MTTEARMSCHVIEIRLVNKNVLYKIANYLHFSCLVASVEAKVVVVVAAVGTAAAVVVAAAA